MRHERWAVVLTALGAAGCTIVVDGSGSDGRPRAFANPGAGSASDAGDSGSDGTGPVGDAAAGCALLARTASWSALGCQGALGVDLVPSTTDRQEYALVAMASPGIINVGGGYDCQWSYLDARVHPWSAHMGVGAASAPTLWPLAIDNGIAALPGGAAGTYAALVERDCPTSNGTCYALIQRDPGDNVSGFRYQSIDESPTEHQMSNAVFTAADSVPASAWLLGYHVDGQTVVRVIPDPPLPQYPNLMEYPRVAVGCDSVTGAAAWTSGSFYVAVVAPSGGGPCDASPDLQRVGIYRYSGTNAGPTYVSVYSATEQQQVLGVRIVADGDALWIADAVGEYMSQKAVLHLRRVGVDGVETLSPLAIPVSWPVPVGCGIVVGAGGYQRPLFRIARAGEYLAVLTQVSGETPLVLRLYDRKGNVHGSTNVAGSVQAYGAALGTSGDGTQLVVAITRRANESADSSGIELSRYSVCPASAP